MSAPSPARMLRHFTFALVATALGLAAFAPLAHSQVWTEIGDAGPLPATAQSTVGLGALSEIDGNLATPDDVDMYCIHVTDVISFRAALQCVAILGPNIWLFDSTGKGVAANSTCVAGAKFVDGTFLAGTGTYYLAVAYDPIDPYAGANPIWLHANVTQRAPDGSGAASPITQWLGGGNPQPINPYKIVFHPGVTFCEAATPAANRTWGVVKAFYR